jgi:hypothetical protein
MIALGFLMYHIGKEYSVFLDNETVTINGGEYAAVGYGSLTIDGDEKQSLDFWADDRVIRKVLGKTHKLSVKILDEDDDSVIRTIERTVSLSIDTRAFMISLAAIAGEAEDIFVPNPLYSPDKPRVTIPDEPDPVEPLDPFSGENPEGIAPELVP